MVKKKYSPSRSNGNFFNLKDIKRLVYIISFLIFLFCTIVVRFFHLQIIEGNKWYKKACSQHQIEVTEYFMRGGFYSNTEVKYDHPNEKVPLVVEVPKFHLFIDPYSIDKKYKLEIAKKIMAHFNFSSNEKEKIYSEFFKKSRSRKIISWIDKEKKEEVLKWWKEYSKKQKIVRNAIFFVNDYKRSYPFGSLLGQVLHTVQEQKDPFTFQALPTGGLELYFNDYLKGKLGRRIITRSLRHPLDSGDLVEKPENGCDVYLTINHYLQAITEEELEKGVKKASAKGGWAIMMDPYTGEILALAQVPFFDIRNYSKYFNDDNLKEATKLKALTDPYEPGSVIKPVTLAICLKANEEMVKLKKNPIFYPDEKIPTANGNFPGRKKPIKDGRRVHKYLNMYHAIQKSSNIYFANLVDRMINNLGESWYRNALCETFGFSQKTKIELPGESYGFIPKIGKYYSNKNPQWSKATPYSLAFGYNLLINSFQLIRAYCIIANGGMDIKPTILKKIVKNVDGKDTVIVDNVKNFKKKGKRILSEESCMLITYAMKFTTKLGGTAPLADIYGFTEAGKSGTAEKNIDGVYKKDTHISSFVGFVPAMKPRFVLMIVVDEPEKRFIPGAGSNQHGGVCAAPIFKEISMRSLKYLGIPPDDSYGFPYPDPRRNAEKADWSKEVKYITDIYKNWNNIR